MTVYAIIDTNKGRTGIAPTYLQTTQCIIALVLYWAIGFRGTTPKEPKALAASRSLRSKLNLAMAVAEVSDDRVLVASPSAEVELGLSISDA